MKHPQIGSMESLDTDLRKRKKLQNVRVMERQKSEVQEKEEREERNRSATADEINERLGNDNNVIITMTADSRDDYVSTRSLRKPKKGDAGTSNERPNKRRSSCVCSIEIITYCCDINIHQDRTVWWMRTERFCNE